ncbi:hypothetical protein ACQJBY_066374 [Aegilops geniculata]
MHRRSPSPAGKTQGVRSTTWTSRTLGAKHRPWIDLAVPVKGWLEASLAMLNQYRENIWAFALFNIKTNNSVGTFYCSVQCFCMHIMVMDPTSVIEIEQKTLEFGLEGLLHLDKNSDTTVNTIHILCVSKCPV